MEYLFTHTIVQKSPALSRALFHSILNLLPDPIMHIFLSVCSHIFVFIPFVDETRQCLGLKVDCLFGNCCKANASKTFAVLMVLCHTRIPVCIPV